MFLSELTCGCSVARDALHYGVGSIFSCPQCGKAVRVVEKPAKQASVRADNQCPACYRHIKRSLLKDESFSSCPHCDTWLSNDGVLQTSDDVLRQAEDDMGIPRGTLDVCMGAD
jgi:hypothetical protein